MKYRFRIAGIPALCLALGLSACATQDAAWVHENLALSENFHAGTKVLETPAIPDTGQHLAHLRATAHTRGKRIGADVELVVRAEFDDFSFLDRVSFTSGRAFPLTVVKRETEDCGTTDRSLCNVHEHLTVKLSRDYLKSKRLSGFNVKLWGRRDSVVLFVPPHYIEGLLARMENRTPEAIAASAAQTSPAPMPAAPAPSPASRRR
ncbi:MAG: hypothetical protein CL908_05175 [Deltaproteobacteria bacterium]|jgi:hypothetical protein|nr:hypothetical protein [Deltaproteobacteria bacterium]